MVMGTSIGYTAINLTYYLENEISIAGGEKVYTLLLPCIVFLFFI